MVKDKEFIDVSLFDLNEEPSISDLYQSIDNIRNSAEENDKIWVKLTCKIKDAVGKYWSNKKNKEKEKKIFNDYVFYLQSLRSVIDNQLSSISSILNEEHSSTSISFEALSEELSKKLSEVNNMRRHMATEALSSEDLEVYDFSQIYKYIRQNVCSEREIVQNEDKKNFSNQLDFFNTWVCVSKQSKYDEKILLRYIEREQVDNIYPFKNTYEIYKVQGQLSKNIYFQRKKLGLTQKQLQDRSGVDHTMIAKIEKLQQPTTLETATKLLNSLNIKIAFYPSHDYFSDHE